MTLPFKQILYIILFSLLSTQVFSLKKDSLLNVVKSNLNDSVKSKAYRELLYECSKDEKEKAHYYFEKSIEHAQKIQNNFLLGEAYSILSAYYYDKLNDFAKSLQYNRISIEYHEKAKNYDILVYRYTHIGRGIFEKLDLKEEALLSMKKASMYAKMSKANTNYYQLYIIGWFEANNGYPDSAITHLKQCLTELKRINNTDQNFKIEIYTWIGNAYNAKRMDREALSYQKKAEVIADSMNNMAAKYDCYRYMAQTYRSLKLYDSSIYFSKKAVDNYIQTKSHIYKYYAGSVLINWLVKDKKTNEAKHYVDILKDTSEFNYKNDEGIRSYFDMNLYLYYNSINNYKEALYYLRDYQIINDSIERRKKRANIGEQNLKLEFQKQQEFIKLEQQQKDFEAKGELEKQKTFNYVLGAAVFAVIILLFMAYKIIKQKQFAFKAISTQKKEVEKQKLLVEQKNKEVLDSIHYAKRIQNALLAHKDFIDNNIPDNFILFKPKDIVSGDFYWATKRNELFYLAVCDCTGHGVPGAFMSLLSIGFLSEAINERGIIKPNEIFNYVRERLVTSIGDEEQKDGFDGILVCFDKKNKTITYSAAHNAPVLVSDGKLTKLPYNKMPVGRGELKIPFELHHVEAKTGDTLYLFTDGYSDQFGGPQKELGGKKFKQKMLNELLLKNSGLTLKEQKETAENNFNLWKGDLEQVDDITIIGIKI